MSSYILSKDAEQDLRDIAYYTLNKWGKKQLNIYRQKLKKQFEAIGHGEVVPRIFSENISDVYMCKAGSHFVFYIQPKNSKPIIIAVIHEARDIVHYLASRLDEDS